ncbi:MAG: serine/threonine-protein kinase [Proteobacteria bacterium]|nr:serine/threonine-protein kinase [Pseudomonadota bacterium]
MTSVPSPHPERYCPTCERSFHDGPRCPDDGTELVVLTTGPDPLLGRSLNERYTIIERLGAGGMGTVYVGKQHSVGRDVAIKVVSAALVTDSNVIKRFLREAKLASRLSHPNAVSILDFGQTADGLFFLVMELLQGRTLDRVLRLESRLRLPRVVRIAGQICEALQGAHKLAIVHRDLKPANVMLLDGTEGRDLIKVLDFGLAKSLSPDTTSSMMTISGALLGTPAYMSPEAARGGEVDERTDLYSLGCMLYVLASGRLPFMSESIHELLSMHTNVAPPPLTMVPPPVNAVIMKLLAKDPGDRFRTAAGTRYALEEAALPFLSSELETAVASTLPGRKKSMPPVRASANTIESITRPADEPTHPADPVSAHADTMTPVAIAMPVAARPVATATVPRSRPRRATLILALAGIAAALVIAGGIRQASRRADDSPAASPPPPAVTPPPVAPAVTLSPAVDAAVLDASSLVTPVDSPKHVEPPRHVDPPKNVDPPKHVDPPKPVDPPPPVDAPIAPGAGSGSTTPW